MAGSAAETLIGALVLVAAGGFLVYASNTTDMGVGGGGYPVVAKFQKAEGINVGSDVRIAGVKVGSVSQMGLDPKSYYAKLTMTIQHSVKLPEDSAAKITSASLLGEPYVAIEPGGSEAMLKPGGEITYTQGSVNVGDLIGKFIHGGAQAGAK
jgi:phospholipid/cholesterol/gamma-HCH transport system substrate-binding protein